MSVINSSLGAKNSISQKIILVNGMNKLSLDFDFVSEEAGRFKDTDYADSFKVTIFRYIDKKAPSIEEFKASLADFESYEKVLEMEEVKSLNDFEWINLDSDYFKGGDDKAYHTGWKNLTIDLSKYEGELIEVVITCIDKGDDKFKSALFIDNVHMKN